MNDNSAANINSSQLNKSLSGIEFPVSKSLLIKAAVNSGAEDDILEKLQNLPERIYDSEDDIYKTLSEQLQKMNPG